MTHADCGFQRVWAGEGNADGTPAYEKKPCGCKAKGLNGCWYSVCAASVPLVEAGRRCKACHPHFPAITSFVSCIPAL